MTELQRAEAETGLHEMPLVAGRRPPRVSGSLVRVIGKRILTGLLTLLCVSLLVFIATQALPSDPAHAILGRSATPASLAALRKQLHLDEPLVTQYLDWVGGVLHGDLGKSIGEISQPSVASIVGPRIVNSAVLMAIAALFSIPFAVGIGALSAARRDGVFDHTASMVSLAVAAAPEFVVGLTLIYLLGTGEFHLFSPVAIIEPNKSILLQLNKLILPALTLVLAVTPYIARMVRASVVEAMESDYAEMARLKGLPSGYVLGRHILPNAIVPTISVLALQFAYLAGGVVVVENVFNYPGIGSALVNAVASRDLPTVQAITLLIGALYVVVNLIADIATILISPRLRTAYEA